MRSSDQNISQEEILQQLKLILHSDDFLSSDRYGSFLEYLVNEVVEGRAKKIKAYPIALAVFGRGPDFDSQTDPIVRVYAGRLREKLKDYYQGLGANDPVRIEIPKGTYVPNFYRSKELDKISSVPKIQDSKAEPEIQMRSSFSKKLAIVTMAGVAMLLLVFAIYLSQGNVDKTSDGKMTVTIRQFDNLSPEKHNDLLARRICNEISTELSRFANINVVGPIDLGSESDISLGQYILEGNVYRENEILKVHITLKDANSGLNLWSNLYTRNLKSASMLYVESEIASRVTIAIADDFGFVQTMLGKQAISTSVNKLNAHQALLLYYDYIGNMNIESHQLALEALEIAASKDPRNAPVWAALSGLYMDKYKHFEGDSSHLNQSLNAVESAASIDPYNRHVLEHLALVAFSLGKYDDFIIAVEKQLEMFPNATMHGQIGMYFCLIGEYERGLGIIEKIQKSNPYYPGFLHFGPYFYHLERGEHLEALREAEMVNMPGLFWDPLARTVALAELGKLDESKVALSELLEMKPNFPVNGIETMSRALYQDRHVELLISGLKKVDLNMNSIDTKKDGENIE